MMEPLKKLLLINPVGRRSGYLMSRFSRFAPLGLAYVAAVTPGGWDIKILDENFDPCTFEPADLVGITAFSSNINRAYAISAVYRQRGTKVILGGIHASMFRDEALRYCDCVITGEVEGIWNQVIRDFENDRLAPTYIGPRVDLLDFPFKPRRDLLHPDYFWQSVQTSRGCPFDCHFCSVTRYLGRAYRQRGADDILDELGEIPGRYIAFVDDNLIGHRPESRQRATDLFNGMIERGLNKRWWMQTSINAAEDNHLVELAAKAGCMFVFIGFETISGDTLRQMHKGVNLKTGIENYKRVVRTFHRNGIGVLGAFVIGNDHESPAYYRALTRFLVTSGIDMFQISILTPLPGTVLMENLVRDGRLVYDDFPDDWDKYRFSHVVHRPEGVSPETIYTGDNYIKRHLYGFPAYPLRLLRSLLALRNPARFLAVYKLNKALKKSWKKAHYRLTYPSDFDSAR